MTIAPAYALEPFDPALPGFDAALAVYATAWDRPFGLARAQVISHAREPGFRGLLARDQRGRAVGLVYGTSARRGQWWTDRVLAEVGRDDALRDTWILTELVVAAGHRNARLGARLHDAILASIDEPRAALSTQLTNTPAQRFYARHDWQTLVPAMTFWPAGEPFVILHRDPARQKGRA